MSDFAATPTTAAPPPEPVARPSPQPLPTAPAFGAIPATAELRREEVRRIMNDPRYISGADHDRAPLVRRVGELLRADIPPDRPRDAATGMALGEPAPLPPARESEMFAKLTSNVRFPAGTSDDDRATFLDVARTGLAALGASEVDVGWFVNAGNEVLKNPDAYTPERGERELRAAFGERTDEVLAAARAAVARLPDATCEHLAGSPVANHPWTVRMLAQRAIAAGWTQGARQ